MEPEPTREKIESETRELEKEMTPVCIDARKKAKKTARLVGIMYSKTSRNLSPFSTFFSKMPRGAA